MDTWELSPGLTACQRRERAGLFPEHRPVVSFPHPVRKQTNPWQRWPRRGPGCGLALTQRKSSFPIFLAIDFFWGGGWGHDVLMAGSKSPAPPWLCLHRSWPLGSIFGAKSPGAPAALSLSLACLPSMCRPHLGCFYRGFPFLGWVFPRMGPPSSSTPTGVELERGGAGAIQDPQLGRTCQAVLAREGFPCRSQCL